MVLASILKERYRKEGRHEAHAEWEAWYERWRQAARAGEPFDEPPPTRNGRRPRDTDPDA